MTPRGLGSLVERHDPIVAIGVFLDEGEVVGHSDHWPPVPGKVDGRERPKHSSTALRSRPSSRKSVRVSNASELRSSAEAEGRVDIGVRALLQSVIVGQAEDRLDVGEGPP